MKTLKTFKIEMGIRDGYLMCGEEMIYEVHLIHHPYSVWELYDVKSRKDYPIHCFETQTEILNYFGKLMAEEWAGL